MTGREFLWLGWCLLLAAEDLKHRSVPGSWLYPGILPALFCLAADLAGDLADREEIHPAGLSAFLPACSLTAASLWPGAGIGKGDVWMLWISGCFLGEKMPGIFALSMEVSFLWGICLMLRRKRNREERKEGEETVPYLVCLAAAGLIGLTGSGLL